MKPTRIWCLASLSNKQSFTLSRAGQTSLGARFERRRQSLPYNFNSPDDAPTMTIKVGFLGLGIMGSRMASRLVAGGADVVLWNRSKGKATELLEAGAKEESSPAAVVSSCSVTFAMLADPKASEAVVYGKDGVMDGIQSGHAFVDSSTIDEYTGVRVGKDIHARGGRYLNAPVSGGWREAAKGELLFIAGGDRSVYDEVAGQGGLMTMMGHKHWFVGDSPADAARAKLMLQIMMGTMIGSLAEMVAVSDAAGLETKQILDMLNNSAMGNPLFKAKGQLMTDKNYSPNFQVYLQQKDLRLALSLADEVGVPAPISAAANNQYIRARQMGLQDKDFASVRESYNPTKEE